MEGAGSISHWVPSEEDTKERRLPAAPSSVVSFSMVKTSAASKVNVSAEAAVFVRS